MKNKRTLIIIGIIAILAVFIYVQVVEITNEKTDYQWEWWVVLAAFILLEALVVLIIFLANRQKYKKLCDAYCKKDYSSVIKLSKCLTSRYLDEKAKDNGRVYLAVANLELGNNDKFLEEINKIQNDEIISKKYFWLAIDSILKHDKNDFEKYKEQLMNSKSCSNKDTALRIISMVEKSQNENCVFDRNELELVKDIKSETLRNLLKI